MLLFLFLLFLSSVLDQWKTSTGFDRGAEWRCVSVFLFLVADNHVTSTSSTDSFSTLHYITLELFRYLNWIEYKTAKPLLYAVYRTRNRKQLGKKWSWKEIHNSISWSHYSLDWFRGFLTAFGYFSSLLLRSFTFFRGCKCVRLIWLQMLRKERSRLCRQNLKVCLVAIISVSVCYVKRWNVSIPFSFRFLSLHPLYPNSLGLSPSMHKFWTYVERVKDKASRRSFSWKWPWEQPCEVMNTNN